MDVQGRRKEARRIFTFSLKQYFLWAKVIPESISYHWAFDMDFYFLHPLPTASCFK